jgi:hypothetical protein
MCYKLLIVSNFVVVKRIFDLWLCNNRRHRELIRTLLGASVSIGIGMKIRWLLFLAYILFSPFFINLCVNIGMFLPPKIAPIVVSFVKDGDNMLLDEFTKDQALLSLIQLVYSIKQGLLLILLKIILSLVIEVSKFWSAF